MSFFIKCFWLTLVKSRGSVPAHGERVAGGPCRGARGPLRGAARGGRGSGGPPSVGHGGIGPRRRRAAAAGADGPVRGALAAGAGGGAGPRGDRVRPVRARG